MQNCTALYSLVNYRSVHNMALLCMEIYGTALVRGIVKQSCVCDTYTTSSLQRSAGQKELLCDTPTRHRKAIYTRKHAHLQRKKGPYGSQEK